MRRQYGPLIISRFAEQDLEDLADEVAAHSPLRALELVEAIRQEFQRIVEAPLQYQLRPEIGDGARMAVVQRYAIHFRVLKEAVRVERIVFGSRDLPAHFRM